MPTTTSNCLTTKKSVLRLYVREEIMLRGTSNAPRKPKKGFRLLCFNSIFFCSWGGLLSVCTRSITDALVYICLLGTNTYYTESGTNNPTDDPTDCINAGASCAAHMFRAHLSDDPDGRYI